MAGDDNRRPEKRSSRKPNLSYNNYPKWKDKLRENCCKRVREDRSRLLWKVRLPEPKDHKELIKSTFKDIVSDELRKIKDSTLNDDIGISTSAPEIDDMLWEYDGLHVAYQGECEEILLEMQNIFYEDLRMEETRREPESCTKTWEDDEDEYLARAVYDHMKLSDEQVHKVVWCPICKQGELQENSHLIYCSLCELKLNRGDEVSLDLLRIRLAETHAEHFERGCKLRPKFCIEARFGLTALFSVCQVCSTFEVVL